jgi:hypothetical protein
LLNGASRFRRDEGLPFPDSLAANLSNERRHFEDHDGMGDIFSLGYHPQNPSEF